jgi:hypothetical protein
MDVYLMVNGQNPQKTETLELININESSIVRFRDCGLDKKKSVIWILARTGNSNAFNKNNNELEKVESYIGKKDDTFDPTYELIFFSIPLYKSIDKIKDYPIPDMKNVVENGISDLEKGIVNPNAKKFIDTLRNAMKDADKNNGQTIISLLDEN